MFGGETTQEESDENYMQDDVEENAEEEEFIEIPVRAARYSMIGVFDYEEENAPLSPNGMDEPLDSDANINDTDRGNSGKSNHLGDNAFELTSFHELMGRNTGVSTGTAESESIDSPKRPAKQPSPNRNASLMSMFSFKKKETDKKLPDIRKDSFTQEASNKSEPSTFMKDTSDKSSIYNLDTSPPEPLEMQNKATSTIKITRQELDKYKPDAYFYVGLLLKILDYGSDILLIVSWTIISNETKHAEAVFLICCIVLGGFQGLWEQINVKARWYTLIPHFFGLGGLFEAINIIRSQNVPHELLEANRLFYISINGEVMFETLLGGAFQIAILVQQKPDFSDMTGYWIPLFSVLAILFSFAMDQSRLYRIEGASNKFLKASSKNKNTFIIYTWRCFVAVDVFNRIITVSYFVREVLDNHVYGWIVSIVVLYIYEVITSMYVIESQSMLSNFRNRFQVARLCIPSVISTSIFIGIFSEFPNIKTFGRFVVILIGAIVTIAVGLDDGVKIGFLFGSLLLTILFYCVLVLQERSWRSKEQPL